MLKLIASQLKSDFLRQAGLLFVATTVGAFMNYLFQVFMGRALGAEVFGTFGALFAIFYAASMVGNALQASVARNTACLQAMSGQAMAARYVLRSIGRLALYGLPVPILFAVAAEPLTSFFHLNSGAPVILLGIAVFLALLMPLFAGLFQGLQRFVLLSLLGYIVPHTSKLLLTVAFVWLGMGLFGATVAMALSGALVIACGLVLLLPMAEKRQATIQGSATFPAFVAPALLVAIFISVPANADVFLVAHFFTTRDAGLYNAAATLGKIVLFLPMAIPAVMLPKVSDGHALGQQDTRLLRKSLVYVALLTLPVAGLYWLFSKIVVQFVFGVDYIAAAPLVGWYGTAMFFLTLTLVFIYYHLGTNNVKYLMVALGVAIAEMVLVIFFHRSLQQVIQMLLVGNLLLLGYSVLSLGSWRRWLTNLFLSSIRGRRKTRGIVKELSVNAKGKSSSL